MLAGAGTVDGRAAGALINALRLAESFDISTDERLEEGCLAIKNAAGDQISGPRFWRGSRRPEVAAERYRESAVIKQ